MKYAHWLLISAMTTTTLQAAPGDAMPQGHMGQPNQTRGMNMGMGMENQNQSFQQMQEMMNKARKTDNRQQHDKLMKEHMDAMLDGMSGMSGKADGMPMGDTAKGAMEPMEQRFNQMQNQMGTMMRMMEQMMQHQREQTRMMMR